MCNQRGGCNYSRYVILTKLRIEFTFTKESSWVAGLNEFVFFFVFGFLHPVQSAPEHQIPIENGAGGGLD
jgi:hypothetical protein